MSKEQVQKVRESGASESQRRLRHGRFIRYFFLTIIRRTGLVNARIQTPPLAKEVGENGVTSKSRVKRSHPSAAPIVWLHTATSQPARSHPLSIRISTRPCGTGCINDGHCFSKQRPVTANAFRSLIVHFHGFRSRTRSARIGPHLLAINSFNKATGLMAVKWLPLCNQPSELMATSASPRREQLRTRFARRKIRHGNDHGSVCNRWIRRESPEVRLNTWAGNRHRTSLYHRTARPH